MRRRVLVALTVITALGGVLPGALPARAAGDDGLAAARQGVAAAEAGVADAEAAVAAAEGAEAQAAVELTDAGRVLGAERAADAEAARRLARAEAQVRAMAIEAYTGTEPVASPEVVAAMDGDPLRAEQTAALIDVAVEGRARALTEVAEARAAASAEVRAAADGLRAARERRAAARAALAAARAGLDGARARLEAAHVALREAEDAWAATPVPGSDIPRVALEAYRAASAAAPCPVPAALLAGIGAIESGHGTFADNRPRADGTVLPGVLGPVLDGTQFARIVDSDGGMLDGDPAFDRAVGPMQFIPQSWVATARDADGDGMANPHDLHDAADAAARYLCRAAGGSAGDEAGLRAMLWSYNRSVPYADAVLARARRYAASGLGLGSLPPAPPPPACVPAPPAPPAPQAPPAPVAPPVDPAAPPVPAPPADPLAPSSPPAAPGTLVAPGAPWLPAPAPC